MVGVPGKSKGCITCRRRKVKCDAERPSCSRCVKSNRTCEGYEKFPVFLNRTSDGLSKRCRLEEARPRTFVFEQGMSDAHTSEGDVDSDNNGQRELLHRPGHVTFSPIFINDGALHGQQFLSSFLEIYLPSGPSRNMLPKYQWLPIVANLSSRSPALESALQALTLSRIGWMYDDEALSVRGLKAYGKALRELQKALWNAEHMGSDQTLASGRLLALFELYESTTNSIKGYSNHESGLSRMIKLRGPNNFQTPMSQAILEDTRTSAMIQAIQFRRSSFFGEDIWLNAPWSSREKNHEQRLVDQGFRIANMLATIDSAKEELGGYVNAERCVIIFNQCNVVDRELDRWLASYKASCTGLLYWNSPSPRDYGTVKDPLGHPGYTFPNLRIATIMIIYWTLRILVSLTVYTVLTSMPPASQPHRPEPMSPTSDYASASSSPSAHSPTPKTTESSASPQTTSEDTAASLAAALGRKHTGPVRLALARRILRSVDYLIGEDMGLFGAQRAIFPFRVALAVFRTHAFMPGVKDELAFCFAKYEMLTDVKGLGFARDIGREHGKWQAGS